MKTVDPQASPATRKLFEQLWELSKTNVLFGQQDCLAYGVGRRHEVYPWRSDVADVCGKMPAVFGWDLGEIGLGSRNLDGVDFGHLRGWIREVERRGGINTLSWHARNPLTGGNTWDTGKRVVANLLPGRSLHAHFRHRLDHIADFIESLATNKAGPPPLIFRPFHEHTGSWFWWGRDFCDPEEFVALWQFTVHYLRDKRQLHHLLYAYSPDVFRDEQHYLESYPGDDYVDVFGLDDYHDLGRYGKPADLIRRLRLLVEMAEARGKIAALTETGFEAVPRADWWTQRLLTDLFTDPVASRIAWVLLWRNDRPDHHYGPYPGHLSAADFIEFSRDERILFLEDLTKGNVPSV